MTDYDELVREYDDADAAARHARRDVIAVVSSVTPLPVAPVDLKLPGDAIAPDVTCAASAVSAALSSWRLSGVVSASLLFFQG